MSVRFTILGCGSSGGVPRLGTGWAACDPNNPKNRRRRCSLLVEQQGTGGITRLLIDTSPDLREQLLDAEVDHLDAVFITHEHADHTHGIDDLRGFVLGTRRRLDIYLDGPTSASMRARFGYCFETPPGSNYPPILTEHGLRAGVPVDIQGPGGRVTILPFLQTHGPIVSLGFRVEGVAYSCDLNGLPPDSIAALAGLDIWIVDSLRRQPHPSHWSLPETLAWIERIGPRRAILTNMHNDLDYETLRRELPAHVEPGYDGMVVRQSGD